jgi:hypothetical protein
MPVRVVLNMAYALLVKDADEKQRRELDSQIYGFKAMEDQANKALQGESGGES